MWREDAERCLTTSPFKTQMGKFAPAFSGFRQEDAHEFLRKLLEGLHEDVNRAPAKPMTGEEIDDDLDDNQKAMVAWKQYLCYDDSRLVDMFVGQLKSSLKCSVCGHCSVTFDPFWDLSLPIPSTSDDVRISECMDLFTKKEVLDGDESPTCCKCKKITQMTKSFSIQKFPKILVLHLKRFANKDRKRNMFRAVSLFNNSTSSKLECEVEFPLECLMLSKYASNSSDSPMYNLIAVANHLGGSLEFGHYTAYCKHPYAGTWHSYNDSWVSSISPEIVCSPKAYVLFYERSPSTSPASLEPSSG